MLSYGLLLPSALPILCVSNLKFILLHCVLHNTVMVTIQMSYHLCTIMAIDASLFITICYSVYLNFGSGNGSNPREFFSEMHLISPLGISLNCQ
jgi:hypothetical protein